MPSCQTLALYVKGRLAKAKNKLDIPSNETLGSASLLPMPFQLFCRPRFQQWQVDKPAHLSELLEAVLARALFGATWRRNLLLFSFFGWKAATGGAGAGGSNV